MPISEQNKLIVEEIRNGIPQGYTLQSIADKYGITRERVRQLGVKFSLPTKSHLYRTPVSVSKKNAADAKYLQKNGIDREVIIAANMKYGHRVSDKFQRQRENAHKRGIEWDLTLGDWWRIWEPYYDQRGRGRGLCMCRYGDAGPYAVGNVYIASGVQNMLDYHSNKKRLEFLLTL